MRKGCIDPVEQASVLPFRASDFQNGVGSKMGRIRAGNFYVGGTLPPGSGGYTHAINLLRERAGLGGVLRVAKWEYRTRG